MSMDLLTMQTPKHLSAFLKNRPNILAVACVPAVAGGHAVILAVACCWRMPPIAVIPGVAGVSENPDVITVAASLILLTSLLFLAFPLLLSPLLLQALMLLASLLNLASLLSWRPF
jgi:hypothetical protein